MKFGNLKKFKKLNKNLDKNDNYFYNFYFF